VDADADGEAVYAHYALAPVANPSP